MLKIQKPKTFGEFLKQTTINFLAIIGMLLIVKYFGMPLIDRSMISAAANGNYDAVKQKLDYFYADVNANNGGTALHAAANIGDAKIAELLLSHGADTNILIDSEGTAALDFAIQHHNYDVARLILAKGVNPAIATTALRQFACETCSVWRFGQMPQIELIPIEIKKEIGEELIRQGADVNKAIRSAVRSNNIVMLDMLISHGADPSKSYDSFSQCIMFEANSPTMIDYLIKHGVDVNCLNLGDYSTALFSVESSERARKSEISDGSYIDKDNNITVLEGLLKAGANPNAQDKKGNTPLFVLDKAEQIAMLLRYGANVNIKNKMGQTPYEYQLRQSGPRRTEILILLNPLNKNKPNKEKRWY